MTHAQATTLVSQRYIGIKARAMEVNQDYILKYLAIINLLDSINKAE